MIKNKPDAAVLVLLGQSNAVGHGIPMTEEDKIIKPLKNVFGLNRTLNQSYENTELVWSGYTSAGMNLAEEQDDTYSVANCLARLWQDKKDIGKIDLPDLYIVHIAIGAQGVTEGFMWNTKREKILIPGKPGEVNISLYPFTLHILSLLREGFERIGKTVEFIGVHWRGGEEDVTISHDCLKETVKNIYEEMFNGFYEAVGEKMPIILHRIVCDGRVNDLDHSGKMLKNMNYINKIFEDLQTENENISVFDVRNIPQYIAETRTHGIFLDDAAHYTPEVNKWVAKQILNQKIQNL